MKRSEIEKALHPDRYHPDGQARIMDMIDTAVRFGYEREKEPAKLLGTLGGRLGAVNEIGQWLREATDAELEAAAEAYNRRGAIEEVARTLRSYDSRRREDRAAIVPPGALAYLARLLEGNPHGADTKDGEGRS